MTRRLFRDATDVHERFCAQQVQVVILFLHSMIQQQCPVH